MTVITKKLRDDYLKELEIRGQRLRQILEETRDLKDPKEGLDGSHRWRNPEILCKIDVLTLRLAIEDFRTILGELSKIKKERR